MKPALAASKDMAVGVPASGLSNAYVRRGIGISCAKASIADTRLVPPPLQRRLARRPARNHLDVETSGAHYLQCSRRPDRGAACRSANHHHLRPPTGELRPPRRLRRDSTKPLTALRRERMAGRSGRGGVRRCSSLERGRAQARLLARAGNACSIATLRGDRGFRTTLALPRTAGRGCPRTGRPKRRSFQRPYRRV